MSDPLLAAAERAKHDLGKYIAFQVRWMPHDADAQQWREGLVSDLLNTRRGPSGTEDAVSIWGRLRPALASIAEPEIQGVDEAMAQIEEQLPGLQAASLTIEEMQALAETAKRVASHLSALHKKLRGV